MIVHIKDLSILGLHLLLLSRVAFDHILQSAQFLLLLLHSPFQFVLQLLEDGFLRLVVVALAHLCLLLDVLPLNVLALLLQQLVYLLSS